MKPEARFSLHQLVSFSLASSFALSAVLPIFIGRQYFGQVPRSFPGWFLSLSLTLAPPFVICWTASLAGVRAVRRGLMDERWPALDVARALQTLQSPGLNWTTKGMLLLGVIVCFGPLLFQKALGPHTGAMSGMIYFFGAGAVIREKLLKLLAPPSPASGAPIFLSNMKPIVSAHWGQNRTSHSL